MGPQIPVAIQAELDKLKALIWNSIGNSLGPGARNSAIGPTGSQQVVQTPAFTTINWNNIESTGAAGTNIPITPKITGKLTIKGVVVVQISGELNEDVVNVQVLLDGGVIGGSQSGIDAPAGAGSSAVEIPIDIEQVSTSLHVTHNVSVRCNVINQNSANIVVPGASGALFCALTVNEYGAAATG